MPRGNNGSKNKYVLTVTTPVIKRKRHLENNNSNNNNNNNVVCKTEGNEIEEEEK